jgi:hypothetical protein
VVEERGALTAFGKREADEPIDTSSQGATSGILTGESMNIPGVAQIDFVSPSLVLRLLNRFALLLDNTAKVQGGQGDKQIEIRQGRSQNRRMPCLLRGADITVR